MKKMINGMEFDLKVNPSKAQKELVERTKEHYTGLTFHYPVMVYGNNNRPLGAIVLATDENTKRVLRIWSKFSLFIVDTIMDENGNRVRPR